MQTIVLITRENDERATDVSVFLCGNYNEANHFCHFVNRLSLAGEGKLVARKITANAEYPLEKYQPPTLDDLTNIDDRTMQRLMRNLNSSTLAVALKDVKEELKDSFFKNMSERASCMLKEDIEYLSPLSESDVEYAKDIILDIYADLPMEKCSLFDAEWTKYINQKENNTKKQSDSGKKDQIVLVFRGAENIAEYVSVYLFDEYDGADNFCNYLNNLKTDKGSFFYAKHADQMVEYETTKPLLVSFDQVCEYSGIYGELPSGTIIREALKTFRSNTILLALKGASKQSRMVIMQSLPIKTIDEINESIEHSDFTNLFPFKESRKAQQEIVNAINKAHNEYSQGKFSPSIMKD